MDSGVTGANFETFINVSSVLYYSVASAKFLTKVSSKVGDSDSLTLGGNSTGSFGSSTSAIAITELILCFY